MSRRKVRYEVETKEQLQDFLWIVRDDIEFLQGVDYRRPTRTIVRVADSILRRLLVDHMYQAAWHFAGLAGIPVVSAIDLNGIVDEIDPRYIHFAYAGGAPTAEAQHSGFVLLVVPQGEAELEGRDVVAERLNSRLRHGIRKDFNLHAFCESPSVISGAAKVSKVGIIRYVANKLGGVHWDNSRKAWTDPVGSRHRLLDENHIMVGALTAPMFEVLSIAHDLAACADTERLMKCIADRFPEPNYSAKTLRVREGREGSYAEFVMTSNTDLAK